MDAILEIKVFSQHNRMRIETNAYRDKCHFRLPRLTFGHGLSARGIALREEKVVAVVNARPPQNVSKLRYFVQLVHAILGEVYS